MLMFKKMDLMVCNVEFSNALNKRIDDVENRIDANDEKSFGLAVDIIAETLNFQELEFLYQSCEPL